MQVTTANVIDDTNDKGSPAGRSVRPRVTWGSFRSQGSLCISSVRITAD
jgi:hypothetical protein